MAPLQMKVQQRFELRDAGVVSIFIDVPFVAGFCIIGLFHVLLFHPSDGDSGKWTRSLKPADVWLRGGGNSSLLMSLTQHHYRRARQ